MYRQHSRRILASVLLLPGGGGASIASVSRFVDSTIGPTVLTKGWVSWIAGLCQVPCLVMDSLDFDCVVRESSVSIY